jgi:hypothetical protein
VSVLIFVICVRRYLLPELQSAEILSGLIVGAVCTLISFCLYWAMRPNPSGVFDATLFDAYMRLWDTHRTVSVDMATAWKMGFATFGVAVTCLLFCWRSRGANGPLDVFAVALFAAAAASGTLYFLAHFFPFLLPSIVERVIPARFPSVDASLAGVVAIGCAVRFIDHLSAKYKGSASGRLLLRLVPYASLPLIALSVPFSAGVSLAMAGYRQGEQIQIDDHFWSAVRDAHIAGPVLTQYAASRPALSQGHLPIALDITSFDFIPYFPDTVSEVAHIIQIGYGVSFFNPPTLRTGRLWPPNAPQQYWARLSLHEWFLVRRELGVVAVIAPTGSQIALWPRISGPTFTLYDIPADTQ